MSVNHSRSVAMGILAKFDYVVANEFWRIPLRIAWGDRRLRYSGEFHDILAKSLLLNSTMY